VSHVVRNPLLVALALLAALLLGMAPGSSRALSNCDVPDTTIDADEQAFIQLLNDYRASQGLQPVAADPALVRAATWMAIDLSGRPFLAWSVPFARDKVGEMDTELFAEFFRAFATNAGLTMHMTLKAGTNAHHVAEACFKAAARALRQAVEPDPRAGAAIPSTKGVLEG